MPELLDPEPVEPELVEPLPLLVLPELLEPDVVLVQVVVPESTLDWACAWATAAIAAIRSARPWACLTLCSSCVIA